MARYRPVFTGLWVCDDKFQDYSASAKLLFLFLITNDHLGEAGIYKITYKTMSNETALTVDRVKKLIQGELKNNVSYDEKNNVVFVHKFLKFNGAGNPELIKKSISKDQKLIKTTLWKEFDNYYTKDLKYINNPLKNNNHLETLSSNSNTNSNSKDNSKKNKDQNCEKKFSELWEIWPKEGRFKKQYCEMKFMALCKTKKLEEFIATQRGYINFLEYQEKEKSFPQKCMHLSTFLNNWEADKEQYIGFEYKARL